MDIPSEKARLFLRELGELCRRHDVWDLSACSCCDGVNVVFSDNEHIARVWYDGSTNRVLTEGYGQDRLVIDLDLKP